MYSLIYMFQVKADWVHRRRAAREKFEELYSNMTSIYRTWHVSSDEQVRILMLSVFRNATYCLYS